MAQELQKPDRNRRKHQRYLGHWLASISVRGRELEAVCVEVSLAGARLKIADPPGVGVVVPVVIDPQGVGLKSIAKISWSRADIGCIGVEYTLLSESQRDKLGLLIEDAEPV